MYKDFYEKEIKEISKILEKENIHIIETWTNFQKYIYNTSDEKNICTDLVLTLDQNPKYMKVVTLEEIKDYMKSSLLMPEFFSLQYNEYADDNLVTKKIDFEFYEYDQGNPLISIRAEYKKAEDYEGFGIKIDTDNTPYTKDIMIYVNNILEDLENEFDVDLSSEKFDITYKEKIMRESWTKIYKSPIFGEYTLRFKIYEENYEYTIEIENSLTDKIYKVKDSFSSYHDAVDWMGHIKDNLIPFNNNELEEMIQNE